MPERPPAAIPGVDLDGRRRAEQPGAFPQTAGVVNVRHLFPPVPAGTSRDYGSRSVPRGRGFPSPGKARAGHHTLRTLSCAPGDPGWCPTRAPSAQSRHSERETMMSDDTLQVSYIQLTELCLWSRRRISTCLGQCWPCPPTIVSSQLMWRLHALSGGTLGGFSIRQPPRWRVPREGPVVLGGTGPQVVPGYRHGSEANPDHGRARVRPTSGDGDVNRVVAGRAVRLGPVDGRGLRVAGLVRGAHLERVIARCRLPRVVPLPPGVDRVLGG